MRNDTFRQALSAAARVAGCAALIACNKGAPPAAGGNVAGEPTEAEVPAAPTTDAETVAEASPAACETTVADALGNPGPDDVVEAPEGWADEAVTACCQQLADAADQANTTDFPYRGACCEALDWQGSMACTPWGPPRPPSLA